MTNNKQQTNSIPLSVPVPSADLINYRFDQSDAKFKEMGEKLDTILMQSSRYVKEEQVRRIVNEEVSGLRDTVATYRKYLLAIISAVTIAVATVVAQVLVYHR